MNRSTLAQALEKRRQQLGMSCAIVAERAGLSLSTVQRALANGEIAPELETLDKIADALGVKMRIEIRNAINVSQMKAQQAKEKARRLAAITQGTSALEAMPIPSKTLAQMESRTAMQLLCGSPRRLWCT